MGLLRGKLLQGIFYSWLNANDGKCLQLKSAALLELPSNLNSAGVARSPKNDFFIFRMSLQNFCGFKFKCDF